MCQDNLKMSKQGLNQNNMERSFDELLPKLGGFGRYQILLLIFSFIVSIINSSVYISYIFTTMDVKSRCRVPQCESKGTSYSEKWTKYAIPTDDKGDMERCLKYKHKGGTSCQKNDFSHSETESCNQFVFKEEELTITQDFNLECEDNLEWKLSLIGTGNFGGQILGSILAGFLSDKIGRKKVISFNLFLSGIIGMLHFVWYNYWWFLLLQILNALFGSGSFTIVFVLMSEMVTPKWRSAIGNFLSLGFALGMCYVGLIAQLTKDWKTIIIITHAPEIFLIISLWIIPESIRWNLVQGNVEDAKKSIRKLAKVNKKHLKEEELDKFDKIEAISSGQISTLQMGHLFKSKILLIRLAICSFVFFTCAVVYYGLTVNSVSISSQKYLNFYLTALVEIPAYFLLEGIFCFAGRKVTIIICFATTSVACIIYSFVIGLNWVSTTFFLFGKFTVTICFAIVFIYFNELFPTYLRATCFGTCSAIGRTGSMLAPLHAPLANIWSYLPTLLYAAAAGFSAFLCLFLPETRNKRLPDTIKEAENLNHRPAIGLRGSSSNISTLRHH